jgi:hypothetical protein
MPPPLFPIRRGDPLPRSRSTLNALMLAGRGALGRAAGLTGAASAGGSDPTVDPPQVIVHVRNDTESALPAFSVLKIGEPLISGVDDPHSLRRTPCFPGTAPTDYTDPFVITIGPAAPGVMVRAAILGVMSCDVILTNDDDGWARPGAAGGTAKLESSAEGGPAKIIWKGTAVEGVARALVLLQGDMGAVPDPASTATDYKEECVDGFKVRYVADDETGDYVFDEDTGVPCKTPTEPPAVGTDPVYPIVEDLVTRVCKPCGDNIGDVVIKLTTTSLGTCWLKADGGTANRTTYAALFAAYGTTHGAGDGTTTFGLPTLADPVTGLSYFIRAGDPTLTVERKRIEIDAFGRVSPAECEEHPKGCCPDPGSEEPTGRTTVGETACCPEQDQAESVFAVAEGPLGVAGATREVDVTLDIVPDDRLAWIGIGSTTTGDEVVEMYLKLFCSTELDEDEEVVSFWRLYCEYTDGAGKFHRFTIGLDDDDGTHLVGEAEVPDRDDLLTFVIERPCAAPLVGPSAWCSGVERDTAAVMYLRWTLCTGALTGLNGTTTTLTYDGSTYWTGAGFGVTGIQLSIAVPGDAMTDATFLFHTGGIVNISALGLSPFVCSPFTLASNGDEGGDHWEFAITTT